MTIPGDPPRAATIIMTSWSPPAGTVRLHGETLVHPFTGWLDLFSRLREMLVHEEP